MSAQILHGDCIAIMRDMPEASVDAIVTDPPYHLTTGKKGGTGLASVNLESPYGRSRIGTGNGAGGFMGMKWDGGDVAMRPETWAAALRVLKPGGYLLAFSGTRTYHRMACAIEDAGFEIRDQIGWAFGSGFPKSHNGEWGGTALKPAWEPICMARKPLIGTVEENWREHGTGALNIDGCRVPTADGDVVVEFDRAPGNVSRENWRKGTCVGAGKPVERGRWPANLIHDGSDEVLAGFPQSNHTTGGSFKATGAFPIASIPVRYDDGGSAARFFMQCKGDYNDAWQDLNLPQENANTAEQSSSQQRQAAVSALVLAVSSALPEGLLCSGLSMAPFTSATANELRLIAETATQTIQTIGSKFWRESKPARLSLSLNHASDAEIQRLTDTTTITVSRWKSDGSAEPVTFSITPMSLEVGGKDCAPSMDGKRFIYCAKASKADRDEGLEHLPEQKMSVGDDRPGGDFNERLGKTPGPRRNVHPTVKPTDLMRYLCRLVTPAGGTVLDPFAGSGSTGKAAVLEGFHFIGIELEAEYVSIARARIAFTERRGHQPGLALEAE